MIDCHRCGSPASPADDTCPECGKSLGSVESTLEGLDDEEKIPVADGEGLMEERSNGRSNLVSSVRQLEFNLGQKIVLAGTVLVVVGAVLPWFAIRGGSGTIPGYRTIGVFPLALGLLAGILGAARWDRLGQMSTAVLGTVIVQFTVSNMHGQIVTPPQFETARRVAVEPGLGMLVGLFGGILLVFGAFRGDG